MPPSIEVAKCKLRRRLRAELAALDADVRRAETEANTAILRELLQEEGWPALAAYMALPHECDPTAVVEGYWAAGRVVWLPRMLEGRDLAWHPVTGPGQLAPGAAGIREPLAALTAPGPLPEGCRVVVPGLAFTAAGGRLGQGGGCYDRVLGRGDLRSLGYAFRVQVLPELPREPHDQAVDEVLAGGELMGAG